MERGHLGNCTPSGAVGLEASARWCTLHRKGASRERAVQEGTYCANDQGTPRHRIPRSTPESRDGGRAMSASGIFRAIGASGIRRSFFDPACRPMLCYRRRLPHWTFSDRENNPVKAGLVDVKERWLWPSPDGGRRQNPIVCPTASAEANVETPDTG